MRRAAWLLVLLVAANLVALAWWQGWLERWLDAGSASPLARQVAPERVEPVPLARFESARRQARSGCWQWAPLEDAVAEKLSAWVRAHSGVVEGEALRPGYRLRFASGVGEAEQKAALAEVVELAGRPPAPCGP